ncbi:MAG: hypothetical protein CMK97_16340 [Pseudomonas sp.]|nr:hypothetical protein [Pseudomonas sp.]MBB49363.1 hypothetical protein [Pseudomonadales bacterium]|tara:strand:+ start:5338 stop:7182 length:1845 start_codon:yes stop_codon:yes gene_type:complete
MKPDWPWEVRALLILPEQNYSDESLLGYLARVADENFLPSVGALLAPVKLRVKGHYSPEELLEMSQGLGLSLEHLQQLAKPGCVESTGADWSRLRKQTVAVCPHCLNEEPYVRKLWHHELVTACPVHSSLLVHCCPECDQPIPIGSAGMMVCRCGFDYRTAEVRDAGKGDLAVATLLQANDEKRKQLLGLDAGKSVLADFDGFLIYLGLLDSGIVQRRNASISFAMAQQLNAAAYPFISDLVGHFEKFVTRRVEQANQQQTTRFISALGAWYKQLAVQFGGDAYAPFRKVAYRVVVLNAQAPINRKLKQISAELWGLKSVYTVAEAARVLNSCTDRIVPFVKSGLLEGRVVSGGANEFCIVSRVQVEQERHAAQAFTDGKAIMSLLGISRRVRDRLIEAGIIRELSRNDRPLFAKGGYRIDEVKRSVALALETNEPAPPDADMLSLEDINERSYSKKQVIELYQLIFRGDLKPAALVTGEPGLQAYRFNKAQLDALAKVSPRQFEFSIADLTRLTPWKHETINSWIKHGHLKCQKHNGGGRQSVSVSLSDLIEFLSTHVVVADAARRKGTKSVWLSKSLAARQVSAISVHQTAGGAQRGVLFCTDALIDQALGD